MDPFSSTHIFTEPAFERLGEEMENKFAQKSIRGFIESLPKAPNCRPPVDFTPFQAAANVYGERQMYAPLVSFLPHTSEVKESESVPQFAAMRPFLALGWQLVNTSKKCDLDSAPYALHQA